MPPGVAPIGSGSGISAAKQGGQRIWSAQVQLDCTAACRQWSALCYVLHGTERDSSVRVDKELQVDSQTSLVGWLPNMTSDAELQPESCMPPCHTA